MLSLKNSVNLDGFKPQTCVGVMIVQSIFESRKFNCTITSANDSQHKLGSLHGLGRAFDVRTKDLPSTAEKMKIRDLCKIHLGPQFDVLLEGMGGENEHLHIEWDPKTAKQPATPTTT